MFAFHREENPKAGKRGNNNRSVSWKLIELKCGGGVPWGSVICGKKVRRREWKELWVALLWKIFLEWRREMFQPSRMP